MKIEADLKRQIATSNRGSSISPVKYALNFNDQKLSGQKSTDDLSTSIGSRSLQKKHCEQASVEAYVTPGKLSSMKRDSAFSRSNTNHSQSKGAFEEFFSAQGLNLDSSSRQKSPLRISNFLQAANGSVISSIGKKNSEQSEPTQSKSQGHANVAIKTSDKFKAMIDKLMLSTP